MKLILVGCEYTGKTTLVGGVQDWIEANMGDKAGVHDHFTIPYIAHRELSDEERQQVLGLSPGLKEEFQRYMIIYHLQSGFLTMPHHLLVGFHIEEAVYAPRYFGYGRPGEYRSGAVRGEGPAGGGAGDCPGPASGLGRSHPWPDEGADAPARAGEGGGGRAGPRSLSEDSFLETKTATQ